MSLEPLGELKGTLYTFRYLQEVIYYFVGKPQFQGFVGFCLVDSVLSAPKSQRFVRFAIAMPIADPRNRAISETRESNAALRFKSAMESR